MAYLEPWSASLICDFLQPSDVSLARTGGLLAKIVGDRDNADHLLFHSILAVNNLPNSAVEIGAWGYRLHEFLRTRNDPLLSRRFYTEASRGNLKGINSLSAIGANINWTSPTQEGSWTAMHNAATRGLIEVVEWLLKHRCAVNVHDIHGDTPLHQAAHNGHGEIVKMLIASGASIDAINNQGKTPMWFASWYGRLEVVQLLTWAGASPSSMVTSGIHAGSTPHDIARSNPLGKPGCSEVVMFFNDPANS